MGKDRPDAGDFGSSEGFAKTILVSSDFFR